MNLHDLSSHHAILITNHDRKNITNNLWEELRSASHAHRLFDQTILDIDSARTIISWAKSSYDGERRAIISFSSAGIPAQNALLKILEEPEHNTKFILITTSRNNLLGTVLSRLEHHRDGSQEAEVASEAPLLFLSISQKERMQLPYVIELLSRVDEEGRKDRESVKQFIVALVPILLTSNVAQKYCKETLEIASYASDPSSSGKALLEYLTLLLPQIKD